MSQPSLKRTTSMTPKVTFGNPRAAMEMHLPAVFISNDKGILSPMPVGRNPRRSIDPYFACSSKLAGSVHRDSDEASAKSGDVELAKAESGRSLNQDTSPHATKRRDSHGPGDRHNPRRPSQGPADEQPIQESSKSMDFSGFQRAMLLAGAKLVGRSGSQTDGKKHHVAPAIGKHDTLAGTEHNRDSCQCVCYA